MPFEFDIFPNLNLIWNRGYGTTTMAQALSNMLNNKAHPDYHEALDTLSDMRAMVETNIDFKSLSSARPTIQSRVMVLDKPAKSAVYVPTELGYGMGNIYIKMMEGTPNLDARLFTDINEALDFLIIPSEQRQLFVDGKPQQD